MATKSYFSHTDSLGRDPGERARAFGYFGGVGENIAAGYSSAQSVFNAWKASPGHNANMLYGGYRVIGIGRLYLPGSRYGVYWTTDFGLSLGSGGTPTPSTAVPSASPTTSPTPIATPAPTVPPTEPPTPAPTPSPTPTPPPPTPTPVPPSPTPVPTVMGDVDCDSLVSSVDALGVLRIVTVTGQQPECSESADVDCDGQVTTVDALEILLYVVSRPQPPHPGCPTIGAGA